jgi:4,5-DOPA dioxygenase extradiol
MSARMPTLFVGHGTPMNTLERNVNSDAWRRIAADLPRPEAILAISAHWYAPGLAVTATDQPATLHDFSGFPRELFEFRYPAPGDPALAERVRELLAPLPVASDLEWGLDHGTWSVLAHLYPGADIPVVHLSLDSTQPPAWHADLARRLAPLRDEGVLILGSGNVVHNLRRMDLARPESVFGWAEHFSAEVRQALLAGNLAALVDCVSEEVPREEVRLAVPTPEHYLPLLYVMAQQREDDAIRLFNDRIEYGSIGMLCCRVG